MKNSIIGLSFIFLILISPTYFIFADDYRTPWIPPTNAFNKIHSDNGTINAVNFSMPLNIKSGTGISVNSNNSTHTLTISNSALSSVQGTYNKTLANNLVINSGGNRINFINGTNSTTHVIDDPTRNQVNITISSSGSGSGITSINSDTTAAQIIQGTSGNITVTDSGATHTINTGNNLAYIAKFNNFTNNNSIAATKKLYLDGGSDTYITESAANKISLFAGTKERFRLQNGTTQGILAIGDLSNTTQLFPAGTLMQIIGNGNPIGSNILLDTYGFNPIFTFRKALGTINSPTAVTSGQGIGQISFNGYSGSAFVNSGAILDQVSETWTSSTHGADIIIATSANGGGTRTNNFAILNDGNLAMNSGKKLNLDGVAGTGDTYITESSANVMDFFTGGTNTLDLNGGNNRVSLYAGNFTSDANAKPANHYCTTYFVTGNSTFRNICNFNGVIHVLSKG